VFSLIAIALRDALTETDACLSHCRRRGSLQDGLIALSRLYNRLSSREPTATRGTGPPSASRAPAWTSMLDRRRLVRSAPEMIFVQLSSAPITSALNESPLQLRSFTSTRHSRTYI